jgi:hypothetical protein
MPMIAAAARLCRILSGCALGLLGLAFLLPSLGLAMQDTGLRIILADQGPDLTHRTLAYFAEQKVTLTLALTDPATCPVITARLVQQSQRLEAEWDLRPRLDCPTSNTRSGPHALAVPFVFAVPKVERQTRFEWRFLDCDSARQNCEPLLRLGFTAYPRDLLAPLQNWAEAHILVVKDAEGVLQKFLESRSISFVERFIPGPREGRVVSLVVERNDPLERADLDPLMARGEVVLFREKIVTLPHIKSVGRGPHRLTTVEMALLDDLAGNPLAQDMFLEIFRMTQEGKPKR